MDNKSRALNILSLIFNTLIFGAVLAMVIIKFVTNIWSDGSIIGELKYFELVSTLFLGIAALAMIPLNIVSIAKNENKIPVFFKILKMSAVLCATVNLVITLVYDLPKFGFFDIYYVTGNVALTFINVVMNGGAAVLALICFIFFEVETKVKFRYGLFAAIPMVAYIITYCSMISYGGWKDIYEFNTNNALWLYLLVTMSGSFAGAILLWLLNKILQLIIVGYVYEDDELKEIEAEPAPLPVEEPVEEKPVEEPKEEPKGKGKNSKKGAKGKKEETVEEPKEEPTEISEPVPAPPVATYKDGSRVYHISRSNLVGRSWKVKLGKGDKAIKIFATQKDAIDYAKTLVRSQGGSIRVHSMQGRIRKD